MKGSTSCFTQTRTYNQLETINVFHNQISLDLDLITKILTNLRWEGTITLSAYYKYQLQKGERGDIKLPIQPHSHPKKSWRLAPS